MIHITQGHEKSIATEVLLRSLFQFPQKCLDKILIHHSLDDLKVIEKNYNGLYQIRTSSIEYQSKKVNFEQIQNSEKKSNTLSSLENALSLIKKKDILITMPTSKNQFDYNDAQYSGYTDYFRRNIDNLGIMLFKYKNTYCLLLSDHIPLKDVPNNTTKNFSEKINKAYNSLKSHFNFNGEVFISGLNPHAGEDGIIGSEEISIKKELGNLKFSFSNNLLPADTIHFNHHKEKEQLFIFFYHDQALSFFKNEYGLFGINVTLNLPFLRFSVDHGTAFNLYNKKSANFLGCYYVINEALKIHE